MFFILLLLLFFYIISNRPHLQLYICLFPKYQLKDQCITEIVILSKLSSIISILAASVCVYVCRNVCSAFRSLCLAMCLIAQCLSVSHLKVPTVSAYVGVYLPYLVFIPSDSSISLPTPAYSRNCYILQLISLEEKSLLIKKN